MRSLQVIGGGLAGTEAAWQLAEAGLPVDLYEMRPVRTTPAHQTDRFAELVCSNSLKSDQHPSASWLLKEELRRHRSVCLEAAEHARVPGGHALTVDRTLFAEYLTGIVERHPGITIHRREVTAVDPEAITIIATGPLTSDALAQHVAQLTGNDRLYFYDSISPIVAGDSIDLSIAFRASRYGKSLDGTDDYLNCPFNKAEYETFLEALRAAEPVASHIPDDVPYFEACLPIEEIARRGPETLRFGPMKPMGLTDPRTGRRPYAVVQLRQETARADSWNLVGFQNHLKFGEQKRILRLIPGLEQAEFLRFGQIHRNTYINAPACLAPTLQLRSNPRTFFAGQISGVEGYVESIATGLVAAVHAIDVARGRMPTAFPRESALGSLCHYISHADAKHYQPANIAFDLFPPVEGFRHDKPARQAEICRRALESLHAVTA